MGKSLQRLADLGWYTQQQTVCDLHRFQLAHNVDCRRPLYRGLPTLWSHMCVINDAQWRTPAVKHNGYRSSLNRQSWGWQENLVQVPVRASLPVAAVPLLVHLLSRGGHAPLGPLSRLLPHGLGHGPRHRGVHGNVALRPPLLQGVLGPLPHPLLPLPPRVPDPTPLWPGEFANL